MCTIPYEKHMCIIPYEKRVLNNKTRVVLLANFDV